MEMEDITESTSTYVSVIYCDLPIKHQLEEQLGRRFINLELPPLWGSCGRANWRFG